MLTKLIASVAAAIAGALLLLPLQAQALTYGIPVAGIGNPAQVGLPVGADHKINFYIPLSGSQTYGVAGGGMTADSCSFECLGTLTMYVMYNPAPLGTSLVDLTFGDLDLSGVADPTGVGFVESISFYDGGSNLLSVVTDIANFDNQQLHTIIPNVTSSPYYAKIVLTATIGSTFGGSSNDHRTTWINTQEWMVTSIQPVPLPAALPLLTSALVGFGIVARRRRKTPAA